MTAPKTINLTIGNYDICAIPTGIFALDGGAMFGTVPKVLWQKSNPADELNRIPMEARALLLSYDAKMKEVADQSARIIASAKDEARAAGVQASVDLGHSITRRLAAAEEQIESAVKAAEIAVRNQAIAVSVQVAGEVLARQMTTDGAAASVDAAIAEVAAKLH